MSGDPNLSSPRTVSGFHDPNSPISPSMTHDGTGSYNGGDIAMENVFASPLSSPHAFMGTRDAVYISLNTPASTLDMNDSDNQSLLSPHGHHHHHHHVKRFDRKSTRRHLLRIGFSMLAGTIFFSAAMCVCLKSWEGFRGPIVLSKQEVRVFNALMIGLSLCLGLNLLASLQNYASVLRWSLLSRRYISLEAFDLILGLERLSNVAKLMFISLPLVRRRKYLRKLRWFKNARQDNTKWTWLVCLVWLLINIGSQVLVALTSLFYPMETSQLPLMSYGDVSVADLTQWHAVVEDNQNTTALEAAWLYGMEAIVFPEFATNETQTDLSGLAGTPLYKGNSYYEYQFFNRNPLHPHKDYLGSKRKIRAIATCNQLDVNGSVVETNNKMYIEGKAPGETKFTQYYLPQTAGGAITWMAAVPAFCGPRCTNFTVLQLDDSSVIEKPSLFLCNSTVSDVQHDEKDDEKDDIVIHDISDRARIFGTDYFARTAAGAMGWTGMVWDTWDDMQSRLYTQGTRWSPAKTVSKQEVEDILMRFTIGAIGAFDDHGIRFNVTKQYVCPIQGQQLEVDWSYILCILGGICFIQFAALCCLLLFANRAIVRDDSFFSIAMLLGPVVDRIGSVGMNMSGEEIKEHPKLKWKKIRYDYREGRDGDPNQVDIFFEGKDSKESRKSWAPGAYS